MNFGQGVGIACSQARRGNFNLTRWLAVLLSTLLWLLMPTTSSAAQTINQSGSASGRKQVVASVGDKEITADEIEAGLGVQIVELEERIYQLKRQRLDALVSDRLIAQEAARRQITVPALLAAEVTAKIAPVTEPEITAFYQANQAQLRGADPATIKPQIKSYLFNQRLNAQREAFLQSLRAKTKVVLNLPAPRSRVIAAIEGAPFKGGANAPVTIIEFSDFHCPFCAKAQPILKQVLARYGDKVKLVYHDFPLDQLHPQARRAAEAARCANDQNKFWPYHDQLYAGGADTSLERLKAMAQAAGLDVAAFESCLASGKHQTAVQRSVEEASRLGLTGTPAFLINGRFLSGAQPLEAFVAMIEEELALAASNENTPPKSAAETNRNSVKQ